MTNWYLLVILVVSCILFGLAIDISQLYKTKDNFIRVYKHLSP